jgi:hypothetical protein
MAAAQFCSTCGSPLTNGVCMTCPVKMFNPAPQPSGTPSTTPIAPSAAYHQPVQWGPQGQLHAQWGSQGQWSASTPWNAPLPAYVGSRYIGMWNWGAFLLCPLWLMNHGRVWRGILALVVSFIPLGGLVSLAMAIAYGIKGNEVATTSRRFYDDAQFVAVQNAWRNWGFGVFVVSVVLGVFIGVSQSGSTTHGY